jgi:hypothetical protein
MTPATHTQSTEARPNAGGRKPTSRDPARGQEKARTPRERAKATRPPAVDAPFVGLDAELLADLQDLSAQRVRAMIRSRPLAFAGGAFATGFVVGGGWRTRVGRLLLFGAARYVAVHMAERYLQE